MPKQKQLSFLELKLNEYLFNRLSKLTDEQKHKLNSSELALIGTKEKLRLFITWGSLDKKLAICTKVGIQFFIFFYEDKDKANSVLQNVYKQHRMKELTVENIEKMASEGIFVTENKNLSMSLTLLAHNSHSDLYYINKDFMQFRRLAKAATDSKKNTPTTDTHLKSEEALKVMARFVFEAISSENYTRSNGLQMIDIMILLLLYPVYKKYLGISSMQRSLEGIYKSNSVAFSASKLFEHGYIDKFPSVKRVVSYTITAKGMNFVGGLLLKITNSAFNGY